MSNYISLENSIFTLNGAVITGFSEDSDALSFPSIPLAQEKYGADGQMIAAGTGTHGGRVGIKLLATSDSNILLSSLAEQQKAGAAIVYEGFYMSYTTGSTVTMTNGVLVEYNPYSTLGKGEVGSISYIFAFESINGNLAAADFI